MENITSKIGSGSTPRGSNYSNDGIPFFRSQNVHNEGIVYEDIKYITPDIHSSMAGTEVLPMDLLLNITGGSIGRCAVIPNEFITGNVSQHVCIIRPILIDSEYLHSYILSNLFWSSMKLTGSGREGLPKYNLEQMMLPLPPIEEQKRIVKSIKNLNCMVSEIEVNQFSLNEIINETKFKILELAMQGKLVPQNPADEPAADMLRRINPKARIITDNPHSWNIPRGWVLCTMSEVIESPSSKPYQILQKEILSTGAIPVISQSSNFIEGYTNNLDKTYSTKEAIVIFGDHTRNVKYFTRPFVVGADGVKLIEWNFNKKFLYYCTLYVSSKIQNKGYSRHFQYLTSYVIGIPPLNEQKRIVAKIEELYAVLVEIEASLQS